jgi:YD repeat-containing protein
VPSQRSVTPGSTYDRAGRVLTEGRSLTGITGDAGTNTQSFTYDPVSRVTGSSGLAASHAYTYDLDANRLTRVDGGITTTFTYDRTDELINQVIGATTKAFAYDAFGNMTQSADAASVLTTSTYDEANRLTAISPAGGTAGTFGIDALGRAKTRTVGAAVDTFG